MTQPRWNRVFRLPWAVFLVALTASPIRPAAGNNNWISNVPSAPVATPPVEKNLSAGRILRLKVQEGKALKAWGRNVAIYPFRAGKPAGREVILSGGAVLLCWSRVEADEAVVVGRKGGRVKILAGAMPEVALEAGRSFRLAVSPGKPVAGRFVNVVVGDSLLKYTFQAGGEDLPDNQIGPSSFRTIVLLRPGDFSQKTWKTRADAVIVNVIKGKVRAKLGQPFP